MLTMLTNIMLELGMTGGTSGKSITYHDCVVDSWGMH